ncbi:MAG TPA: cytochrome c [Polyangiaceae bacterium]|nr:cytochrome c [Polyangiaceae bacterium]
MKQVPRLRAGAKPLWRASFCLLAVSALPAIVACNERPSDLRQWQPRDHDHTENPGNDQVQVDPTKEAAQAVPGLEDVTIVAWSQNCTQCHGQLGRGDGPRGPMLKATNLSDPAWQSSVTDEQIAATIKLGRGAMPSFKQLPDVTIANLVKLVRMMNLARLQERAAAAESASATPSASAVKPAPKPSAGASASTPKPSAPAPKPSAP